MSNLSKVFNQVINAAVTAAGTITDPKDKAIAYAEIGKAIATTNLLQSQDLEDKASCCKNEGCEKETPVKDKPKTKETSKKDKVQTPVKEEPVEEKTQENSEATDEVDLSELDTAKANFNICLKEYGEETMNTCVAGFSNDVLSSISDITDDNVIPFMMYIFQLLEGQQ